MERILNNPEILQKLEKAFGQLSTALRTFSKVCGLLVVSTEKKGALLPILCESDVEKGALLPISDSDEPTSVCSEHQPHQAECTEARTGEEQVRFCAVW